MINIVCALISLNSKLWEILPLPDGVHCLIINKTRKNRGSSKFQALPGCSCSYRIIMRKTCSFNGKTVYNAGGNDKLDTFTLLEVLHTRHPSICAVPDILQFVIIGHFIFIHFYKELTFYVYNAACKKDS